MEIEDQVLSISQIQELQELGFDVEKYASMCWISGRLFVKNDETTRALCLTEKYILTLSIGDMIEVLPEKIKTYSANADEEINFYPRINNTGIIYITTMIDDCIFCSIEGKLINNLFNCLVWCIKNLK